MGQIRAFYPKINPLKKYILKKWAYFSCLMQGPFKRSILHRNPSRKYGKASAIDGSTSHLHGLLYQNIFQIVVKRPKNEFGVEYTPEGRDMFGGRPFFEGL